VHSIDEFYQFYLENFSNTNSELYKELNPYRQKAIKFFLTAISGILLAALFFILISFYEHEFDRFSNTLQGLIIGFIVLFIITILVFLGLGFSAAKKYKDIFKERVIRKIIEYIDPNLKYYPNKFIERSLFTIPNFFPNYSIDKYEGDDLVEGVIGKTPIRFSELHVQEKRRTDKSTYYVDIFKGLFINVDFNKHFKGRTYVLPDKNDKTYAKLFFLGEKQNTVYGELVKLENPEFEKICAVFSSDQIEARYILSTSLMNRIVQFRNRINREVFLCFANSQIYVAIPYKKNLFEPKIMHKTIKFELLKEYYEILLNTIGIVDELNLNVRIWTKE